MNHYVQLAEIILGGIDVYSNISPIAKDLVDGLFDGPKVAWAKSIGAKIELKRQWKDTDYSTHVRVYAMLTEKQYIEYVLRF